MFELINGPAGLSRELFKSNPNEQGAADMIALDPSFATLALFQTGDLFAFPMQLLDFPAEATQLLSGLGGVLSWIIGHDPIRAVGRHLNPETLHLVLFGKALDLEPFAVSQFVLVPPQRIDPLIGTDATGVINQTIIFERTVINLV